MKTSLKLVGLAAFAALTLVACKKSGPTGTYNIDKVAMKAQATKEIEKMPREQQAFGQMMLSMIDAMDMSITLEEGGKAKASVKMGMPGKEPKAETKEGTWKEAEGKIVLSGVDKADMTCTQAGDTLTCGEGAQQVVFKKG